MALSAAAESWLLLLYLPLAFSCCRESHTGDRFPHRTHHPPCAPYISPCCPGPLVVDFPILLPTGSCQHTIGSFRMESGGRVL
ncbi:unnamed protein product [Staurois parvus]|uniref:Uncharacterized protein n=1 Tax=Staurois parvus TaxID=386267 RepID=A0ABN9GYQ7_9NEOB|nr:unnamed protein product [Staurois parvus]